MQRQLGVLLVGYVANGPRQVEVAVDAPFEVYCAASTINAVPLLLHRWLVVNGERHSATALSNDTAAIARVRTYERLADD